MAAILKVRFSKPTIWKLDDLFKMAAILVGFQIVRTKALAIARPFENRTSKWSVFKCFQYSDPSVQNFLSLFSDRLVGIYKTNNATKSVTINPEKISQEWWVNLGTKSICINQIFLWIAATILYKPDRLSITKI